MKSVIRRSKEVTIFRYGLLDDCFCRRLEYSSEELYDYMLPRLEIEYGSAVKYSKRQLTEDINNLKNEEDAPIVRRREGNIHYYKYSDPNYSYKNPVYQRQLSRLSQSIIILGDMDGLPHEQDLIELRMRLQHHKNKLTEVHDQILVFNSLPKGGGAEHVASLYDAIAEGEAMRIAYKKYNCEEVRTRTVHPYSLVEYERYWYLYCFCEERGTHRVFSLDRICDMQKAGAPYRHNDIAAKIYFKDIIGVTRSPDEEVQDIELLVSPKMAPYFLSRPLHHSQYRINAASDAELHIGVRLMINPELIDKLMGYGPQVKVLKSERLRERMRDEVERMREMYRPSPVVV